MSLLTLTDGAAKFYSRFEELNEDRLTGGSPGLVVMGGDSCSEGRGFKSQHYTRDGHFSHIFAAKY